VEANDQAARAAQPLIGVILARHAQSMAVEAPLNAPGLPDREERRQEWTSPPGQSNCVVSTSHR